MISLLRALDDNAREKKSIERMVPFVLSLFDAFGNHAERACPAWRHEYRETFDSCRKSIAAAGSFPQLQERIDATGALFGNLSERLRNERAHLAAEARDVMHLVARVIKNATDRGGQQQGYFVALARELEATASLNDLHQMKQSLSEQAEAVRVEAQHAAQAGEQLAKEMEGELAMVRQRLENYEYLATHDKLTDMLNRAAFDERVPVLIAAGRPFSIILFDLNGFKQINDNFGHLCGDLVLREFGQRLKNAVRAHDFVFRWGGDEFVALLTCGEKDATPRSHQLRAKVCGVYTIVLEDRVLEVPVRASVGLTEYQRGETMQQLFSRADELVYRDKMPLALR